MDKIMQFISLNKDALSIIISFLSLLLAFGGGVVALIKWGQQIRQARAEKVKELICKIRDDKDIATVMDIIDWNNGFYYDGKFHLSHNSILSISDSELFNKIDKTLSHFSYICYLNKKNVFNNKDMANYEYVLRRLPDNPHIANYLYSLYHWSKRLNVHCSFHYLIDYSLKNGYLEKDFEDRNSKKYKCYLQFYE